MTEAQIPIRVKGGYATVTISVDGSLGEIVDERDLLSIGRKVIDDVDQQLRHTIDVKTD